MTKVWYTDGSCKGNPGPGGWGAIEFITDDTIDRYHNEECLNTTNNRMELTAILYVTQLAAKDPNNEYLIYSDSSYCVRTINEWMRKWATNNWIKIGKNEPIENQDLIKQLYNLFNIPFFNVKIEKVLGHVNIIGNELADKLAKNEIIKFRKMCKDNNIYFSTEVIPKINIDL